MGEKLGKDQVSVAEFSENRFAIRAKSGEGGCSVVVDLGRKGFYASYTPDGCGGKTITTAAQFEYDRHGFEGYLGNDGLFDFQLADDDPYCANLIKFK